MPAKWSYVKSAVNTGWGIPEELMLTRPRRRRRSRSYNGAAISGCGYTDAALTGYGLADMASSLAASVGSAGMNVIERLAERLQTSLLNLLQDPDQLINNLLRIAPAVARKVVAFFKKYFTKKREKKEKEDDSAYQKRYMQWLKKNDPATYKRVYREMQQKAWDEYKRQHQAMFVGDENDDDSAMAKMDAIQDN